MDHSQRVVELGAGVGLTGFVIAGCCGAKSVHMTDYTDACLLNLAHNILINNGWLSRAGIKENITQGYLEWTEFLVAENAATTKEKAPDTNMVKLREADLLIAADVIYDVSVIEALVAVIQTFLSENPEKKEVIHAITKRNLKTFEIFLQHLKNYNIRYDWIADGRYCANLPNAFKCNFNQPWSDIQIASLKIQS
jgi:predicted nicotinamide N-methyase